MCIPGIFNNGRFMNMTYDMIHGGLAGSMNLMFNQNIEHCMTFPTLYTMPNNIFNYSPYGTIGSNNYLLDPTFPIFQSQFGMGGNFGGYGMPMMPWMNPEMMKKMWSFDGTDSTLSSTDSTTRKYNKMLSLLRNIANSDKVKDQDVKDKINEAIRNNKGKVDEKLERLTKVYEDLDKDLVKKALREANNIGYAKKSTSAKDSFRTNLEAIGFEYGNGDVDKLISKLYNDIKEIKSDGSVTGPTLAGAVNEDNILDYISSWNTKFADYDEDSDKRILSHIAEYYNDMQDGEGAVRSNLINPLVDALKNKADDVKDDLPKSEKAKIDKAVKELTSAWDNGDEISDDMIEAFDNLYVLVRMAALANFNEEVIGYYGELDEDLFNEDLFTEETIEDLKVEGFSKSAIKKANENVAVSDDDDDDNDDTEVDDDDKTESKQSTPLTDAEKEIYQTGKNVMAKLYKNTDDEQWADIKSAISNVTSRNVLEFLAGCRKYASNKQDGTWYCISVSIDDGFFEQSGNENRYDSTILGIQVPVLEALIKCINENINDSRITKENKELLKKYKKAFEEAKKSSSAAGRYIDNTVKSVHEILKPILGLS